MKKTILFSCFFVLLGTLTGIYIFNSYKNNSIGTFKESYNYYFLQEGVYSNEEIMRENTKELDNKLIDIENDKYYVYLGITTDQNVSDKIKQIYKNKGYQIYIKEVKLASEEFYNNVVQFDLLINNTEKEHEILTIEEVVLANYEEIIKNSR